MTDNDSDIGLVTHTMRLPDDENCVWTASRTSTEFVVMQGKQHIFQCTATSEDINNFQHFVFARYPRSHGPVYGSLVWFPVSPQAPLSEVPLQAARMLGSTDDGKAHIHCKGVPACCDPSKLCMLDSAVAAVQSCVQHAMLSGDRHFRMLQVSMEMDDLLCHVGQKLSAWQDDIRLAYEALSHGKGHDRRANV